MSVIFLRKRFLLEAKSPLLALHKNKFTFLGTFRSHIHFHLLPVSCPHEKSPWLAFFLLNSRWYALLTENRPFLEGPHNIFSSTSILHIWSTSSLLKILLIRFSFHSPLHYINSLTLASLSNIDTRDCVLNVEGADSHF